MARTKYKNQPTSNIDLEVIKTKVFYQENTIRLVVILRRKKLQQCNLILNNNIVGKVSNKKNLPIDRKIKKKLLINDRAKKYEYLVKQLYEIVRIKKQLKYTQQTLSTWLHEFRKLEEGNHITTDRMERVLDWYEKNIGGEFIPVVESAYSFRLKFFRLEDAMQRQTSESKTTKKKFIIDDGIKYVLGDDGRYRHSVTGDIYIP